ncbi:SdrD B-like domain-containing protein [Roseimaritima ulvae]|nr:SdrD B-like domain-containing protein [Roseimaritima ulvae]
MAARSRRRIQVEALEDRRLLALLGVDFGYPSMFANSTGTINYDATTNTLVADASPELFQESEFWFANFIDAPKDFSLQLEVDESGNLVGGVPGDDFVLSGVIDIDFDGTPDLSGTLLTGEVIGFGFLNSVGTTDTFDFRIEVTGGVLTVPGTYSSGGTRPAYFAGQDIGMRIDSEESSFNGSFNSNFSGKNKATFGPTDPLAELGNYVWVDTNQNGLQDDGNTGVNDVTVDLYVDVDGDGIAEPGGDDGAPVATTVTADLSGTPGYYLFPNLDPDDYFVVFDPSTLPTGFEFTTQGAGSDDAVDSDADTTTGIAEVTTLDAGESDLTWDAGIFQTAIPLIPAIDIEKCVEHTVVGPGEMHVLDFNDLASGTVVDDEYSSLGVTISVQNDNSSHPDKAVVFDSANPTGGDNDLATPGYHATNNTPLGNVLVIAENDVDANNDQLIDNPDDEASGGTITFTFDDAVRIDQIDLLDVDSSEVGGSVVTVNTANGSQTFNIAALGDNSFQTIDINVDDVTSLSVNFISSGAITGLKFTKPSETLECDDADVGPGPSFNVGDSVTFNYTVTNAGEVDLKIVEVSDDNATPGNTGDDFNPDPVLVGIYNIGDTDQDGELDLTEAWQYTYTITAATAGQFTNISDVLGNPVDDPDVDVVDDDPANYVVVGDPGITIEKFTNGVDAENESQAAEIAAGDTVTWTYEVTNTGEVAFTAAEISIVDDNGTPTVSTDDFGIGLEYNGSEIVYSSGDGGDGILSPGETWTYTATGTALALPGGTVGSAITFDFGGSSSTDGSDGNTRSYSAGGVDVDVRAFSRDKSNGNWAPAYLGSYGGGLGVTDSSEGSGGSNTHTVDNVGRDNYVLFEYSEQVVVDAAYLGYVVNDSDLTIWIGNSTVPLTGLSDAVLTSLGFTEVNLTNSSSARWADLNAGEVAGNVLVIAAKTDDATPEDRFKIEHVKVHRTASGCYENIAVVTAGGVSDSDASYYCNTEPGDPGITIEKFTNGVDAENESQAAEIAAGDTVTWTYEVTNTGEVAFTAAEISIVDDNGTPTVSADDFGIGLEYNGSEIVYSSGDGGDGILSPGETWTYTATGTALALPGGTVGSAITFDFGGSSSTDGSDGNTRSYSAGGVDVDVRAFSRDKSNGNWAPAYLGSYGGGLGVTDSSEGSGGSNMHTVDNVGRDNYVLFEYSEQVVVDAAYLGYVVDDSDLTIWIGNSTVPLTGLSDAVLTSLGFTEVNLTNSSSARWADLNAGEVAGNVLVIAAKTDDATPEDRFKIEHIKVHRTASGCYENIAVVTAGGVSDSDASYYCNPEVVDAAIDIEKFVKVDSGQTGGGEGLTPGFWKTHSPAGPAPLSGWPETGFSHLDNYNTVFGVSDDSGLSLLDALGRGGGGTSALGRHATAALLNAANPNVDYSFTQAEVISLTQAAYGSGDASLIENTKNLFAVQNELGADLSTPANAPDSGMDDFGVDADSGPGPAAQIGDQVVFTYFVTNPGDVELYPVVVIDDNATTNTGDDFQPDAVEENDGNGNFFNVGDDDQDGRLDPGETWLYQEAITVTMSGQFTNIGSVSGTPVDQNGNPVGPDVSDDDPANYNVAGGSAGIDIEKLTNGEDADTPGTAVEIAAGETITWTYKVTNTGTTHFNQSDVVVTDDNGTSQTGDDLSSVADGNVEITLTDQGDNDGVLAPGEVWTYTATGTAEQLSGGITGDAVTVYLTGSTSTSGTAGNSKTFTSGGVSVTASAFSRDNNDNWSSAYLGAYSSGLGVTDGSEGNGGDGRHRVDNTGRMNYVLFEFSESVVVDQAFLDSVVRDSDITAWVGTVDGAFSLNDAVLDLLAKESNDTGSSSSRWADLNNGQVAGNVLVIAASVDDATPEDSFKIRKLKFYRTAGGVYTNVGTVQAGGVSDSDLSHYVNPDQAVATGEIGNYVWNDVNRNGKQDSGEPSLSGVTVKLLDVDQNEVATTTTNSAGLYSFSGLDAGQYFVKFIAPQDMVFSPQGQGDHADHGSNANSDGQTDKIYLAENEIDNTIDAGLYAAAVDLVFEAEDYERLDSPWQVRSSSSASGGEYIKTSSGTGSYYNTPPSHSKVTYQFDVASEGNYEISALLRAKNSSENSIWVKVDDQPWVQWHMDLTGRSFQWQAVTDGWDQQATQFHLTAGQHSLQLRVREDGVRLDKFMVSKLSTTTVVIDAMATTTNLDSVDWEVGVDSEGNEYLLTANGTGSHYSTLSGDELSYDFSVDQDGEYQMHALVNALNSSDNSFWISIDGGQWIQWHLSVTNGEWQWQTVSDGSSHDQVSFNLEAGSHTLKIKVREDGTMLDKIVISNDSALDLDSIG